MSHTVIAPLQLAKACCAQVKTAINDLMQLNIFRSAASTVLAAHSWLLYKYVQTIHVWCFMQFNQSYLLWVIAGVYTVLEHKAV